MVASSIAVDEEESVNIKEAVNASSYVRFHNAQIFQDGLSFSGNERNKTWINTPEGFVDLSEVSGSDIPNDSRASIACDFDDDGDVDLFVHSIQRERHALFRNDAVRPGEDAGFLKLRLKAMNSQYEAIGATVIVHGPEGPVAQVMSRGAGFLSCQADELIFGLGDAKEARVEVLWPGGEREAFGALAAGTRARLVEGSGQPESYGARPRSLPDPPPDGLNLNEGDILPKLAVFDAKGRATVFDPVQIAGGRNLLLTFWASYCDPCVKEIPDLQKIHASAKQGVAAISLDVPSAVSAAIRRLERGGAEYPAFFLGRDSTSSARPKGSLIPSEDASAHIVALDTIVDLERMPIPTTLVLSPEGRIETILRGPLKAGD
ncbi:MAG: hypothetical protein CMJ89_19765 [Planctomycetes bacterium]|nr:hypothetical protein [Planctomycetota bacterium]